MKKRFMLCAVVLYLVLFSSSGHAGTLFEEKFDNANFSSRGWYDGTGGTVNTAEHIPGSTGSFECHWNQGSSGCTGGLPQRHKFTPTNSVYVSFWLKHSAGWTGKGTHITYLLTTEDVDYSGLSRTHLDAYINEGTITRYYPDLELQDASNVDESKINVDLTRTTEYRAAQGCNGLLDNTQDFVSCYLSGSNHINMRNWVSPVSFTTGAGSYSMTDWHQIEAYYELNDIDANGKGMANGILRFWLDGRLLIDKTTVNFRTGARPNMQFNQFILAPYQGPSEVNQSLWIDELTVATAPPGAAAAKPSPPRNLKVQ